MSVCFEFPENADVSAVGVPSSRCPCHRFEVGFKVHLQVWSESRVCLTFPFPGEGWEISTAGVTAKGRGAVSFQQSPVRMQKRDVAKGEKRLRKLDAGAEARASKWKIIRIRKEEVGHAVEESRQQARGGGSERGRTLAQEGWPKPHFPCQRVGFGQWFLHLSHRMSSTTKLLTQSVQGGPRDCISNKFPGAAAAPRAAL